MTTIKLTPTQKQLLKEAKTRDNKQVTTYGVSDKTIGRLVADDLVKRKLSHSGTEILSLRETILQDVSKLIDYTDSGDYLLAMSIASELHFTLMNINATMYVLTQKGIDTPTD